MTEPSKEQINRTLHEFMGKCDHYHEGHPADIDCSECILCGGYYYDAETPDYTSPDSPRRLLDEVEEKLDGNQRTIYANTLFFETAKPGADIMRNRRFQQVTAPAPIRARALYEVITTEGK